MTTRIQIFLLGALAAMSIIVALYFLRFWRETRDSLFLSFAAAFAVEGISHVVRVFMQHPNEGSPWLYLARLAAFVLIIIAVVRKNYRVK